MTDPSGDAGYTPRPGTPLVTQADRWQWQYRAVRTLAAILDTHPDLPAITWTLGSTGGLAGHVNGLGVPPEEVHATFTAWRKALRLEDVKEAPIRDTGIVSLSGVVYYSSARVALAARICYPMPDEAEPADVMTPRESRKPQAGERGPGPAKRPDRLQTGPPQVPRSPEGPQLTQGR